jgi:hypothetical protein
VVFDRRRLSSVGAGVGIYAVTKGDGTPDTTFGNTVLEKMRRLLVALVAAWRG